MRFEILFSRDWLDRRSAVPVVVRMKPSCVGALLLGVMFALTPHVVRADVVEAWVRRHNTVATNSFDQASKVVVDKLGDVIVGGYTDQASTGADMLTIKYSGKDGSLIWKRLYDGPAHSDDRVQALAIDHNGDVVITGSSAGAPNNTDFYTAKYSRSDGALVWERRFDGPVNASDLPQAVVTDRDGNVIVAGYSVATLNAYGDFYTAKYAAQDGSIIWERRYDGPAHGFDAARGIAVDNNGDILVTGESLSDGGGPDYYTAKYAAGDGAILWEKRYNGSANYQDRVSAISVDRAGNAVVTGGSFGTADFYYSYHVVKYGAADGAVLWEQRGPLGRPVAILTDSNGDVVVTGYSSGHAARTNDSYYTAKYAAADGALLWERRYNGRSMGNDHAAALALDSNGDVFVTGRSIRGTNYDYATIKYAATDGALLWERISSGFNPRSTATDGAGDVIVSGFIFHQPDFSDIGTEKYNGATGALRWRTDYNDASNDSDSPGAIALDVYNNVTVTGASGNGARRGFYTVRYAAADGALLWERRSEEFGKNGGSPVVVRLDRDGNAIITGTSFFTNSSKPRHVTLKYASADGALLWQKIGPRGNAQDAVLLSAGDVVVAGFSHSGTNDMPGRSDGTNALYVARYSSLDGTLIWENRGPQGSAAAVVVDALGNVVTLGTTFLPNYDFYTVKYRGIDGTVLWDKHYNGSGNGYDYARALAVDHDGNIAVTGSAANGQDLDFYTAKYRAADGLLMWERSYSGIGNGHDEARALAIDRNGNVIATGWSWNGTNGDFYTAKYGASDGALLWERRGPPGFAEAVAVDGAGDVVVAGNSVSGTDRDYYAAKYAGTDGAVIWQKGYNSGGSRADFVGSRNSLAISGDGVIAVTGSSDGDLSPNISYDFATVVYWENISPIAIERLSSDVRVRFSGIPGRVYHVQRANDLDGPWITLSTQTAPVDRVVQYSDDAPVAGSAFYRVRMDQADGARRGSVAAGQR